MNVCPSCSARHLLRASGGLVCCFFSVGFYFFFPALLPYAFCPACPPIQLNRWAFSVAGLAFGVWCMPVVVWHYADRPVVLNKQILELVNGLALIAPILF